MHYLNEKELLSILIEYVENRYFNFAILINGEWGSGKTYFATKKLVSEFIKLQNCNGQPVKEGLKIVYISLYDIYSVQEIANRLILSDIKNTSKIAEKASPYITTFLKMAAEKFGTPSIINDSVSILLASISKNNDRVFIFDDLERAHIPITEILGFVNTLVEQYEQKVIIIGNEAEFCKNTYNINLEQKYRLACLDDKIDFSQIGEKENKLITLEKLQERVGYLFGTDFQYNQIKEKLIGLNIYFRPAMVDTIENIVRTSITDDNVRIKILGYVEKTVECFEVANHCNFRTFQHVLMLYSKINIITDTLKLSKEIESKLCEEIYFSILRQTIEFKKGNSQYKWNSEGVEYNYSSNSKTFRLNSYHYRYRFIDDYLYFSSFNSMHIENVLQKRCERLIKESNSNSLFRLKDYYYLDNISIENELALLLKNLDKDYCAVDFQPILSIIYKLKSIGIIIDENNYIKIMQEKIKQGEEMSDTFEESYISEKDEHYLDYQSTINNLKELSIQTQKSVLITSIQEALNDSNWPELLSNIFSDDISFFRANGFLSFLTSSILIEKLDGLSVKLFVEFRKWFYITYNKSGFYNLIIKDKPILQIVRDHFLETTYTEKMKDYNKLHFIDEINTCLQISISTP